VSTDPWHTLTVTGLHFHNDPQCPGHTHPDENTCPDEIEHELTHPDDCPLSDDGNPYRCQTDQEVLEFHAENGLPTVPGTYRVRGWFSGPDYWGEYDNGAEHEDVTVPAAPTQPATCKHEPWPKPQTFTPPPLSAVKFELIPTDD
jgi:hypothetical protein